MATAGDGGVTRERASWPARLALAWRALRGDVARAAGVAVTAAGREAAALHPQGPVIEALVDGLHVAAIVLDRDGRVIAFNGQAGSIAPAMNRGEPALISLRMPELVDAIRRAGKRREPQRVEFFERVPTDRWFEAFVTPVKLPGAERGADIVLLTFNDLTPLRRVEEMRADFIANASHELRTPLAALLGFIETLQGPARNDTVAREKFLGIMQQQATRMARLIDDLLSLSRIELNVPPGPVLTLGDRDELLRVFENLVENALKYGASGKRVDVTLTAGASEALIAVRDYGPGIAPEHLPRLTERFYRVDPGQSRAKNGTGLGLAIVKHILARHRGRLTIASRLGEGSTFTALAPLAAPTERDAAAVAKS
jgi:two-component system phosphate regulon sensor histidine kinase PhoR